MAQETTMGVKDQHTQHDAIGDDEVSELQRPPSFYQKVREQVERFASTRLGQFVIERADRGLKLIEDTTKWSLPQDKNSSSVVLERPLPWVPFLLLIIALRLVRIWLSVGALMIGNGPVSPTDMIYFIQTRRRKLRAIRVHGLRTMRNRQQETSSRASSSSYAEKLSQWVSRAICRPGVQRVNSGRVFNLPAMAANKPQTNQKNESVAKRPRDEDLNADQNLTIDEMLSKYANENSEDDSDFVPNAEDENTTSGTSSESESESHSSEQISSNEEQEQAEQHKENIKPNKFTANHVQKPKEPPQATLNGNGKGNGNGNGNEREPMEVAALKEEQWKSSPGHLSAALLNTRLYNNTAAAGSPDTFNSDFVNHSVLRNVIINAVPTHSTPNSELEEIHSAGSDVEEATRQCIALAHSLEQQDTPPTAKQPPVKQPQQQQQQQQQHQQQQQQRQFNHPHQRYRGRNRR